MQGLVSKLKPVLLGIMLVLLITGCGNSQTDKSQASDKATETQDVKAKQSLFAYVGANLKEPVTEIAQLYEQKTGVKVELTFNNSGALFNQLETTKKGDIYIPGSMPYIEKAKGHIEEMAGPIAIITPVIITPKGNPARISKVEDLAKPGVKLVMPEKEATAIGKAAFKTFDKLGMAKQVEKNVLTFAETPAKVVATITMGQGNAGIVEYSNYLKLKISWT